MNEAYIVKQIKRCEALYMSKPTIKRAFLLSQRYFVSYVITGEKALLHKANFVVVTELEKNPWCFDLYFFSMYIKLAQNEADAASAMLDKIKGLKNSFRKNNPEHYLLYMYFSVILSEKSKKQKLWNEINTYEQDIEPSGSHTLRNINFLKAAALYDDGYPHFIQYLEKSKTVSAMFMVTLAGVIEEITLPERITPEQAVAKAISSKLSACLPFFIKWAVAHGYNAETAITKLQTLVSAQINSGIPLPLAMNLYTLYPYNDILQAVCASLMLNRDYSEKAFIYYKEAEQKQMLLPKLYEFVVISACKNNIEDLSRFSLDSYLGLGVPDDEYKPFIYHLLITGKKNTDILNRFTKEITNYGIHALEKSMRGRYFNSIFKFLLDTEHENMKGLIDSQAIERILHSQMFLYEITVDNPNAKHIFVYEKEKAEKSFYEITRRKAIIKASCEKFSYLLFGTGRKNVVEGKIRIKRLVENADTKLYMRFFEKGDSDPDLLVALSRYYMKFEKPPAGCLEILTKTVTNNSISKHFRMQISATLGNYYSFSRDYAKSVSYYKTVDENLLNDRHIEQMLLVYVNAGEYDRAASFISKKAEYISDRNLFYAMKQIALQKGYERQIADVAYELVLKNWYDKTLIDIVLKHYKGSQEEWQQFSRALSAMSVIEHSLDEIILHNAIWMHKFDRGAQTTFSRMYELNARNPLVNDFAMFCAYEMIINGTKPEYSTIDILEKLYLANNTPMLSYALAHTYLAHNITTAQSEHILKRSIAHCESNNILFPIYKQIKDKTLLVPYIEKNQPFMYRGFPNKTVLLYYKPFNEKPLLAASSLAEPSAPEYRSEKMKYVGFGIYLAHITHFYNEKITYYFSEEMPTGSISSKESQVENKRFHALDAPNDPYYIINNALVYEQMFKYDHVEEIITDKLKDFPRVKAWIM